MFISQAKVEMQPMASAKIESSTLGITRGSDRIARNTSGATTAVILRMATSSESIACKTRRHGWALLNGSMWRWRSKDDSSFKLS